MSSDAPLDELRPYRVFLNIPFDRRRRKIYLALISGLTALGLEPKSVAELRSRDRLTRLSALIDQCAYSFHDLSHLTLSGRNRRLNMPFELGLVIGRYGPANEKHPWFVFERKKYSLQGLVSDLGGYEFFVHGGTPNGVFRVLTDIFHKPGIGEQEMSEVYDELNLFVDTRWPEKQAELYSGGAFRDLVYAAASSADRRREAKTHNAS